jgi:glycosyltransferase involved in cell wall biosynthesis
MKKLAIISTHPIQYHAPWFRMLAERGDVQLKVFYTRPPEAYAYDKGFRQVVVWDIPLLDGYDYQFTSRRRATRILEIADWSPDVLLVFGWSPAGHLDILRHFKGKIPVWFRGDSTLLDEKPGIRQWLRRRFLRWVYRYIDLAFYVGNANKAYFLAHGLAENQLVFAPHAVDLARFGQEEEEKVRQFRSKLGIAPEDISVIFCGKLEAVKNPGLLLRVVQQINAALPKPVHLIFAGDGNLGKMLKRQSKSDPYIHFIGFRNQSEMPVIYRLGDIFCLPSARETWGLAVNEAMACGRPVLVSDRCGCAADLVHSGSNGYVFEAQNQDDLVAKLSLMISQPTQLKVMGRHALAVIQSWSFETYLNSTLL